MKTVLKTHIILIFSPQINETFYGKQYMHKKDGKRGILQEIGTRKRQLRQNLSKTYGKD